MKNYLEFIDHCYDLITEEVIADSFKSRKIQNRLKSYQILYSSNPQIKQVIDNILQEFFPVLTKNNATLSFGEDKSLTVIPEIKLQSDKAILMALHYKSEEIAQINKLFGFGADNLVLTEEMLKTGYFNNSHVNGIERWYQYLKFFHFTDYSQYTDEEVKSIHQKLDAEFYCLRV